MHSAHHAAATRCVAGPLLAAALLAAALPAAAIAIATETETETETRTAVEPGTASDSTTSEHWTLPEILVTAPAMAAPMTVVTDPKQPRQPLPAHDGADYLKTVPGFSVTRKGGADGDATFRGMAGSRLGILVDGADILGGCNFRMDAPTSYVYPELYDRVTVLKGLQSVRHGPGHSAATVLFERKPPRFDAAGSTLHASLLGASANRHDALVDGTLGDRRGYLRLGASHSAADDYEDGDGNAVHSAYERWSVDGTLGWTPDADTRVELALGESDGEAAYADRAMDGTRFLRRNLALHVERRQLSPLFVRVAARAWAGDVDHLMDDQQLRVPGTMGYANLLRDTRGGKAEADLALGESLLTLGIDARGDDHRSRSAPPTGVYTAWADDAEFSQQGLYAELDQPLGARNRLVAGARADRWQATDQRDAIMVMMMGMLPNPTAGHRREENLASGFLRLERELAATPVTLYAGIAHGERFPDYWELVAKRGTTTVSVFDDAQPEKNRQLDIGAQYREGDTTYSLSLFYNRIDDYLLVDYRLPGLDRMTTGVTRNVDAVTRGGELGASRLFAGHWLLETALAYTRGDNRTDHTPLAQVAPLEARLGLTWKQDRWSLGALLRAVDDQHRYDTGRGTIVGQDLGPAPGFAVFSLNAGWKPSQQAQLTAGIDNLFDRRYAEFISRAGASGMAAVPGYVQSTRVNEPGRTLWLKASLAF